MTCLVNQPICIAQGTSRLIEIPIRDENGDIIDLTSGSGEWNVATASQGGTIILTKTTAGGGATLSADSDGLWTLTVTLLPADTADQQPRRSYYHEARVTDQFNNEYVVAGGEFDLEPSLQA